MKHNKNGIWSQETAEAHNNIDDNTYWFRRTLLVFERVTQ